MLRLCVKHVRLTSVFLMTLAFHSGWMPQASAADWWSKPVIRHAVIGMAAGAATGAISDRASVGKGALTGAVVGAGSGYINTNRTLSRKPLVRGALRGALIGSGVSYATDRSLLKGAVVGTGAGAGYHYIQRYMMNR